MREAAVIFPHQLFLDHPAITQGRPVFLLEEQLMLGDYRWQRAFHRQKLMLHRASMKAYEHRLQQAGYETTYVSHIPSQTMQNLFTALKAANITSIYVAEPADYLLEKRLRRECTANNITLTVLPTPAFFLQKSEAEALLGDKPRQASFYSAQRKNLQVLLKENGKPVGGKWSTDTQNRYAYDGMVPVPPPPPDVTTPFSIEAEKHIAATYPGSFGMDGPLIYPHTHEQAQQWLDDFIEHKLSHFGIYQDAIMHDHDFLFHALISPALNIGLLEPQQVLHAVLDKWEEKNIPLNSIEGFVRQIIGWREFMYATYSKLGVQQRTSNFFNHTRPIPQPFYTGTTGILPVDTVIKRILQHGYCHHIERLMVLGNFMLLCEFNPTQVYMWFLELFIDAYDWVMVPNVYGMSQYADGGLITTKPYVSSSNYVRKMSNFPQGDWCSIWDGLYWRFIYNHYELFEKNNRTRPMIWGLQRMNEPKLKEHLAAAESYLATLPEATGG
ncbi:cryptochrome/photolyase family protein [Halodesulfovibrio marinisediminis]|uniref:Deoxyribodipyrimidine photolyase-related protein n=1 Tax=Halodesulfovibrio marinisediminis DSM 17456 TaxID=1121457 RepID=A0A1N6I745_9BACT|nr:cryptochrome/photolyase family protein [Halodesulfovibrio marinisediminis]SIO27789.1 deoxyribodipyrimidine photolyase-related protein [Halodesulfovibrio marinisediminis DSM 17456]